jgi:hypothetical protein
LEGFLAQRIVELSDESISVASLNQFAGADATVTPGLEEVTAMLAAVQATSALLTHERTQQVILISNSPKLVRLSLSSFLHGVPSQFTFLFLFVQVKILHCHACFLNGSNIEYMSYARDLSRILQVCRTTCENAQGEETSIKHDACEDWRPRVSCLLDHIAKIFAVQETSLLLPGDSRAMNINT